jgi:hypothetical protein
MFGWLEVIAQWSVPDVDGFKPNLSDLSDSSDVHQRIITMTKVWNGIGLNIKCIYMSLNYMYICFYQ